MPRGVGKKRGKKGGGAASATPPDVRAAAARLKSKTATSADQKILAEWRNRNRPKPSPAAISARRSSRRSERLGPRPLRGRRTTGEGVEIAGKSYPAGAAIPDAAYARAGPAQKAAIDSHSRRALIAAGELPTGAVGLRRTEHGAVPHFGVSGARVDYYPPEARESARRIFGRDVHESELATLAGAGDTATVYIRPHTIPGWIKVGVRGPGYSAERLVFRDRATGRPAMQNSILVADAAPRGTGLGIFGRQVEQARRMGVSRIDAFAARKKGAYNGYYTWPRFGYDADLPRGTGRRASAAVGGEVRRISDLMKTPEGREWWKQHGRSSQMGFDLAEGSNSIRVWESYLAERIKARGG